MFGIICISFTVVIRAGAIREFKESDSFPKRIGFRIRFFGDSSAIHCDSYAILLRFLNANAVIITLSTKNIKFM